VLAIAATFELNVLLEITSSSGYIFRKYIPPPIFAEFDMKVFPTNYTMDWSMYYNDSKTIPPPERLASL